VLLKAEFISSDTFCASVLCPSLTDEIAKRVRFVVAFQFVYVSVFFLHDISKPLQLGSPNVN